MNYISEGFGSTALKKIFDLKNKIPIIKDLPKINKKTSSPYLGGSITQYTRDLIMTFPLLCDDTLPIETASMISRANERYIISLLQMLFASEQLRGSGGVDVIKKIHKNIKANMSLDDYIEIMDDLDSRMPDFRNESVEVNRARRVFTESLKFTKEKRYPESSFSENSVNDYLCTNVSGRMIVTEAKFNKNLNNSVMQVDDMVKSFNPKINKTLNLKRDDIPNVIQFAKISQDYDIARKRLKFDKQQYADQQKYNQDRLDLDKQRYDDQQKYNQDRLDYEKQRYTDQQQYNRDRLDYEKQRYDDQQRYNQDRLDYDKLSFLMQRSDNQTDYFKKMLVDSEVKKSNELAPSLIVVKYRTFGDDDKLVPIDKPFICGVKSRLISTESRDIIERMISKNKTKISFLNLIRATTGEIGFIKDFIFSLDQAKIDSKNAVKRGPAARIWKTLEYRATKNQKNMLKKAGNDASAITVVVVNQETVNYMKKQFEFNLEDLKNTRMIMDAYNLLGIIICDEALEIAKSYYAGNDQFETQAYSYLEKESQDKSYKKVISLVSQMNGR